MPSMEAIERRIETGEGGCFVRSAPLVELAAEQVRPRHGALQHTLRDLTLLDSAADGHPGLRQDAR
jgi:hypothetical protein